MRGQGFTMRVSGLGLLSTSFLFVSCLPALAYIDPNGGGLIFQLLTPFFALCATAFVVLRQRLAALRDAILRKLRVIPEKQSLELGGGPFGGTWLLSAVSPWRSGVRCSCWNMRMGAWLS